MTRFIDLSIAVENDVPADPPPSHPKVAYLDHAAGAKAMAASFPGLRPDQLPDGEGWAVERVELSTHHGTHMDAPYHYHSTQDAALPGGARPSMRIDDIPLAWCFAPGVKLDFRHLADGHVVGPDEIDAELDRIGHTLRPLDIVVMNTRAGAVFGDASYVHAGCGAGREATLHLTRQGVRVVGTDGWSWDAPFSHTARRFAETGDASLIWEGHKAGRDIGYCQLEKLHNLDQLPGSGFTIACFPVKIRSASAGWTRAVALLD